MSKFLILNSSVFYPEINKGLLDAATQLLTKNKITFDIITIPGALELPCALAMAIDSKRYTAYIVLGCVIQQETDHYKYVSDNAHRMISWLATSNRVPLGNGLITAHNMQQAIARSSLDTKNYGLIAANAALQMWQIKQNITQE